MLGRAFLILDVPEISDEAALQLSEFLQTLIERFDAHYSAQILRAHRVRESEHDRLYRERLPLNAQQAFPLEAPPF